MAASGSRLCACLRGRHGLEIRSKTTPKPLSARSMKLSIVIPIYNESENLGNLFQELYDVLANKDFDYEILAVNDGSLDNSADILKKIAGYDNKIKVLNFSSNFGQTAAISAGIDHASGDIIVPIDSDLENDPNDIVRLLTKMNDG